MINFFIKPLIFKWILTISFVFISIPGWGANVAKTSEINKINLLHAQHVQEQLANTIKKVDEAIYSVIKLPDRERLRFATLITLSCKKYNLDPRIMVSILKVESDFRQKAVSHTGDYSVAQINFKVWAKRFRQMDKDPLHFNRLKEDDAYAIFRMGEILHDLQINFSKKDEFWFARYHSNTPKFKNAYIKKLQINLKKLLPYGPGLLSDLPSYEKIMAAQN
jgi:hypothetical protein